MNIHERLSYWTHNVTNGKELVERVFGSNTPVNSATTRKLNKVIQGHLKNETPNLDDIPALCKLENLVASLPTKSDSSSWWQSGQVPQLTRKISKVIRDIESKVASREAEWVKHLHEFRANPKKNILEQFTKLKATKARPFPSDSILDRNSINEKEYEWSKAVCHATALAIIEFLKDKKILSQIPQMVYRSVKVSEDFIDQSQNANHLKSQEIMLNFSARRILMKSTNKNSFHEFVLVKLATKAFLIQANMYISVKDDKGNNSYGLTVEDPQGFIEIGDEDIRKLYSNDKHTFTRLFSLAENLTPNMQVEATDEYTAESDS